jgi:hypothetical protein
VGRSTSLVTTLKLRILARQESCFRTVPERLTFRDLKLAVLVVLGIQATNITNATIQNNTVISAAQAGVLLENTTGTITLTNNSITGNGVASLVGTNVNNVAIANSNLTSVNSATDGLSLNGVSGAVGISDSTIEISNPTGNGISANNVTGTLTITANNGSQITNTGNYGVSLSDSTGAIALSGFDISDSGKSGIFGTNLSNVTIQTTALPIPRSEALN